MKKQVAVVTGASRGVGRELAQQLAKSNYIVILIARNETLLYEVNRQIQDEGGESVFFPIDVSDAIQVQQCVDTIIRKYDHIDLLINNAAILKRGTTDLPDNEIDELLKINLNGAIYVARHVANQMKIQKNGYIINISSLGGKIAASFSGIYAASKFGLSGFSESLSKEMAKFKVKVTNICPSMIATDMAKGRTFKLDQMIQLEDITKTINYLLSLSHNAIPTELTISCLPLIEKTAELTYKMYLN